MSERIAALDLGTNTFHLLIAEVSEGAIKHLIFSDQKHVKLGEGGITNGTITEAAFHRGIEAVSEFSRAISKNQVEKVRAVGTAALRTAANGQAFIKQVQEITGISIQIIDGEREAALIYQGVRQAVKLTRSSLIMDIGGGSVEFIIANSEKILWKKSYPIGAAKLMALYHHSDPIAEADINIINKHLDEVLEDLKLSFEEFTPQILIGSAGAFETFAVLCQIKTDGIPSPINNQFSFDLEVLNEVLSDILQSTHRERVINPAILPVRTDMIVVASILTQYIIRELNFRSIELSTFSLKEGLLIDQWPE